MVRWDNAKSVWNIKAGCSTVVYFIVHVVDILVMAATEWVLAATDTFKRLRA